MLQGDPEILRRGGLFDRSPRLVHEACLEVSHRVRNESAAPGSGGRSLGAWSVRSLGSNQDGGFRHSFDLRRLLDHLGEQRV